MNTEIEHTIKIKAQIADDFLIGVLLLKSKDSGNLSLPFLQAHALELSAKCALLKLDPNKNITSHNLKRMYDDISLLNVEFSKFVPSDIDFNKYRTFYALQTGDNTIVTLPENAEKILDYELCYFIENIVNLKYGFFRDLKQISTVHVSFEGINYKFLKLFFACRKIYSNKDLDNTMMEKSIRIFGISLFEVYKDHI